MKILLYQLYYFSTFTIVIKFFTYILILVFSIGALVPGSDLSQLMKISELMGHYELHQQEDLLCGEKTDFLVFFVEHVLNEPNHSHDDSSHEDLPFQQFNMSSVLCFEEPIRLSMTQTEIHITNCQFSVVESYKDNGYRATIFHPPIV